MKFWPIFWALDGTARHGTEQGKGQERWTDTDTAQHEAWQMVRAGVAWTGWFVVDKMLEATSVTIFVVTFYLIHLPAPEIAQTKMLPWKWRAMSWKWNHFRCKTLQVICLRSRGHTLALWSAEAVEWHSKNRCERPFSHCAHLFWRDKQTLRKQPQPEQQTHRIVGPMIGIVQGPDARQGPFPDPVSVPVLLALHNCAALTHCRVDCC